MSAMAEPDRRPAALPADDRTWRRGVRVLGLVVAGIALVGTVDDLNGGLEIALLIGGLALWVVELFATPPAALEVVLLVPIGCCGAALRAVASDSAGVLLAYSPPPRSACASPVVERWPRWSSSWARWRSPFPPHMLTTSRRR
jgi:hypothetical protein